MDQQLLSQISQSIGNLDGKMDLLIAGLHEHVKHDDRRFKDMGERVDEVDKRVGKLKNHWAFAAGATAVVTFIISNLGVFSGIMSLFPK